MHLKQYISSHSKEDRLKLAESCKTTVGHLKNVAYGYRKPSAELCVLLEQNTQIVTRQDLCPTTYMVIWPELVNQGNHTDRRKSARRATDRPTAKATT